MILSLPDELFQLILERLPGQKDLAQCCSTSKYFLSFAQPILYRSIRVRINTYRKSLPVEGVAFARESPASLLLSSFRQHPKLVRLVRTVSLVNNMYGGLDRQTLQFQGVVKEFVRVLPSSTIFIFGGIDRPFNTDAAIKLALQAVNNIRGGGGPKAKFRLVLNARKGWNDQMLEATYDGIEFNSRIVSWLNYNLDVLLSASRDTLRFISVPLDWTTNLSIFHRLERLSLSISARTPARVVGDLTRAISPLSSLRFIQLCGLPLREDLVELLTEGKLADSLPPLVSHLSLDYKIPSSHLLSFLLALPDSTSLTRINCLKEKGSYGKVVGAEEAEENLNGGETMDMVAEYGKKGIRLAYDEKWSIW